MSNSTCVKDATVVHTKNDTPPPPALPAATVPVRCSPRGGALAPGLGGGVPVREVGHVRTASWHDGVRAIVRSQCGATRADQAAASCSACADKAPAPSSACAEATGSRAIHADNAAASVRPVAASAAFARHAAGGCRSIDLRITAGAGNPTAAGGDFGFRAAV